MRWMALVLASAVALGGIAGPELFAADKKAERDIVVTLYIPSDTKFSVVEDYVSNLKSHPMVTIYYHESAKGKAIYAEVCVKANSVRRVADVLEELLQRGVPEISLKVKK